MRYQVLGQTVPAVEMVLNKGEQVFTQTSRGEPFVTTVVPAYFFARCLLIGITSFLELISPGCGRDFFSALFFRCFNH